jgi:hypothetical protein
MAVEDLKNQLLEIDKQLEELRTERQNILKEAGIENAGDLQRGPMVSLDETGEPIITTDKKGNTVIQEDKPVVEKQMGEVDKITKVNDTKDAKIVNTVDMDELRRAIKMFGRGGK